MLSKEEIDRIAEEILAGFQAGKEERTSAPKTKKEIPGLSGVADVKAEASVRENRKKQEQEILEAAAGSVPKAETTAKESESGEDELKEKDWRAPLIDSPQDPDALQRMMAKTTARIGVGRCGPRLKTQTLLKLRADHAAARAARTKTYSSRDRISEEISLRRQRRQSPNTVSMISMSRSS